MERGKITIVGTGPGRTDEMTFAVNDAISKADVIVGYEPYLKQIRGLAKDGCEFISNGMRGERLRAERAFESAVMGKDVVVVSGGDPCIYGMAPLIYEMKEERCSDVELATYSGLSAFQKASSLLGCPIGHDFCVISLSDLMTPWPTIERRIRGAAECDFVTAIYNPKSHERYWQLKRLQEIFLEYRNKETPVGYVRNAGREDEKTRLTTLSELDCEDIDMSTVVIIGNSQSYNRNGIFITPRGYYDDKSNTLGTKKVGQSIMAESFRRIEKELHDQEMPLSRRWPLLHAIHTTADFEMERLLYVDEDAVPILYEKMQNGSLKTIVTDVTMAESGIRKKACARYGIEVKCYLNDPRVIEMTKNEDITRSQAGIRLAVSEHPDALYVFGNAPTALMELCTLIRKGKAHPAGVVGAPVGFVHVCESKYMLKSFTDIPKLIIMGRKGGSNIAATLVNSILSWDESKQLNPGRDV